MSCLEVIYINQKSTGRFKTGEIYEIGCIGKDKSDFLILNCNCKFLEKLKNKECRVISYEWGIVAYNCGTLVLLNKDKIAEIQSRIRNGLNIKQEKRVTTRNNSNKQNNKKEYYRDTSMAEEMMESAYIDQAFWDYHN